MDNSEAQKKERGKEVKKRIIALSLVLAMSASLTFPVAAARKDEVQAEKAATESKLSAAESKADELESEKNYLEKLILWIRVWYRRWLRLKS